MSRSVRRGMNEQEKSRLYDICYRSKRDGRLTPEEHRFITEMFKRHREEYGEIQRRASSQSIDDYKKEIGA